jgi:hypothetical protein
VDTPSLGDDSSMIKAAMNIYYSLRTEMGKQHSLLRTTRLNTPNVNFSVLGQRNPEWGKNNRIINKLCTTFREEEEKENGNFYPYSSPQLIRTIS